MKARSILCLLMISGGLLISGCDYAFPLTSTPSREINPQLVGDWIPIKKAGEDEPSLHVRQWDDTHYAIAIDDELYRVHHSDMVKLPFVSAQDLNSSDRRYALFTWALSTDGNQLTLRRVRTEVIPEKTTTPQSLRQLVTENANHPRLLDEPLIFSRVKAR
jgi:hypothetical protein